ncbi:MAG: hypothetical protein KGM98_04905, partial [Bacteroidota bacterium]|nr:hypothetical protein [Bacteroidota bacterium]
LMVSGAIAKGKFIREQITPIDGNQGPYHLSGANGELFFTVLASTEKVFIDGQLMTRGADQDYIIDYNTAEITFTAKRPITKDSRIQIEFEYSDRNFLNSLVYANDEIDVKHKLKVSVGVYSNVDAKNSPINQTLNTDQKQYLAQIGNKIDSAYYPDAVRDTFSTNTILYKKLDTVYNGIHDSIFVYSTSPGDTLYNVGFTQVNPGKGDYIPANTNANGQVFLWVQPVNGVSQGNYAPVVRLVTPQKHQVVTTSAQYFFNDRTYVRGQFALSNNDVNTFSRLDKSGDHGAAAKIEFASQSKVLGKSRKGLTLQSGLNYEYVQDHFSPVERLRNVEFNRDWGLPYDAAPATENLLSGSLQLQDNQHNYVRYEITHYSRSDKFEGLRNVVDHLMNFKDWQIKDQLFISSTQYGSQKGNLFRPSVDVSRIFPKWDHMTLGAGYSSQQSRQLDQKADTLTSGSYSYGLWQVYLKSDLKKMNRWGLSYSERTNRIPLQKDLIVGDRSRNANLTAEFLKNRNRNLKMDLT